MSRSVETKWACPNCGSRQTVTVPRDVNCIRCGAWYSVTVAENSEPDAVKLDSEPKWGPESTGYVR